MFAVVAFPFVAAAMAIPYAIFQYHKYGAILGLRVLIVYSFILYMMCAYFLTILPLPPIEEVAHYTWNPVDLKPLECWTDIYHYSSLVLTDPSTWLPAMRESVVYVTVFNVLLLFPLGVYLHYYFRRNWWQTVLIAFCISLSFELIQLSGLFGIYPRPYRLFQVDDLINNTFGAWLGYLLTPLFSFFLPSRQRLDEESYRKGEHVTIFRRGAALVVDWVILYLAFSFVSNILGIQGVEHLTVLSFERKLQMAVYIVGILAYFVALPNLLRGRTPGMLVVRIALVNNRGEVPAWGQYLIRYACQYFLFFPAPFYIRSLAAGLMDATGLDFLLRLVLMVAFIILFVVFAFQLFISEMTGEDRIFYEKMSRTHFISVNRYERDENR